MSRYISSASIKKSRKARTCIWCGETIEKNDGYFSHIFVEDGQFYNNSFHTECDTACQKYMKESRKAGHYENKFEPYEFARGSTLDKNDYRLEKGRP